MTNAIMRTEDRINAALLLVLCLSVPLCAEEQVSDQQITRSLQEAFKRDFRLKIADVQVSTFLGSVTLRGSVTSFQEKQQAEQVAKRTVGVRSVNNMLQVASLARRNDDLAVDVKRRLDQSSFVRPTGLQVQATSGVVTLIGEVESWAQSRQAEQVASEVLGVTFVRNELTIALADSNSSTRGDEHIQRDVEMAFGRGTYFSGLAIRVAVENGIVQLEGDVPNLYHKDRATEEARLIAGVKTVDNRLEVDSQFRLKLPLDPPTDDKIERSVLDELQADPRVPAGDIKVASARGQITLRGSVVSMFERQMAERIARRVLGVIQVDNQLQVDTLSRPDDEIVADLLFNLKSDSLLSKQPIQVVARDAAVTLTGEVTDYNSKIHALRLAGRVRGVRAIKNELKVRWTESANDNTAKQLIVSRLSSNATTSRVADRIHVTVKEGVVMLAGQVDRSAERFEAERIAKFTDGVREVENRISLSESSPRD